MGGWVDGWTGIHPKEFYDVRTHRVSHIKNKREREREIVSGFFCHQSCFFFFSFILNYFFMSLYMDFLRTFPFLISGICPDTLAFFRSIVGGLSAPPRWE